MVKGATINLAPKEKMLISHLDKCYPLFLFSIINANYTNTKTPALVKDLLSKDPFND